jgi:TM2 domain-containing membrane protein YozV
MKITTPRQLGHGVDLRKLREAEVLLGLGETLAMAVGQFEKAVSSAPAEDGGLLRRRLRPLGKLAIFKTVNWKEDMSGQGSTGNVLAAICSFFVPGLGQLVQGRVLAALAFFVFASVLWLFWLGWIVHLWAIIDAAIWSRK